MSDVAVISVEKELDPVRERNFYITGVLANFIWMVFHYTAVWFFGLQLDNVMLVGIFVGLGNFFSFLLDISIGLIQKRYKSKTLITVSFVVLIIALSVFAYFIMKYGGEGFLQLDEEGNITDKLDVKKILSFEGLFNVVDILLLVFTTFCYGLAKELQDITLISYVMNNSNEEQFDKILAKRNIFAGIGALFGLVLSGVVLMFEIPMLIVILVVAMVVVTTIYVGKFFDNGDSTIDFTAIKNFTVKRKEKNSETQKEEVVSKKIGKEELQKFIQSTKDYVFFKPATKKEDRLNIIELLKTTKEEIVGTFQILKSPNNTYVLYWALYLSVVFGFRDNFSATFLIDFLDQNWPGFAYVALAIIAVPAYALQDPLTKLANKVGVYLVSNVGLFISGASLIAMCFVPDKSWGIILILGVLNSVGYASCIALSEAGFLTSYNKAYARENNLTEIDSNASAAPMKIVANIANVIGLGLGGPLLGLLGYKLFFLSFGGLILFLLFWTLKNKINKEGEPEITIGENMKPKTPIEGGEAVASGGLIGNLSQNFKNLKDGILKKGNQNIAQNNPNNLIQNLQDNMNNLQQTQNTGNISQNPNIIQNQNNNLSQNVTQNQMQNNFAINEQNLAQQNVQMQQNITGSVANGSIIPENIPTIQDSQNIPQNVNTQMPVNENLQNGSIVPENIETMQNFNPVNDATNNIQMSQNQNANIEQNNFVQTPDPNIQTATPQTNTLQNDPNNLIQNLQDNMNSLQQSQNITQNNFVQTPDPNIQTDIPQTNNLQNDSNSLIQNLQDNMNSLQQTQNTGNISQNPNITTQPEVNYFNHNNPNSMIQNLQDNMNNLQQTQNTGNISQNPNIIQDQNNFATSKQNITQQNVQMQQNNTGTVANGSIIPENIPTIHDSQNIPQNVYTQMPVNENIQNGSIIPENIETMENYNPVNDATNNIQMPQNQNANIQMQNNFVQTPDPNIQTTIPQNNTLQNNPNSLIQNLQDNMNSMQQSQNIPQNNFVQTPNPNIQTTTTQPNTLQNDPNNLIQNLQDNMNSLQQTQNTGNISQNPNIIQEQNNNLSQNIEQNQMQNNFATNEQNLAQQNVQMQQNQINNPAQPEQNVQNGSIIPENIPTIQDSQNIPQNVNTQIPVNENIQNGSIVPENIETMENYNPVNQMPQPSAQIPNNGNLQTYQNSFNQNVTNSQYQNQVNQNNN